MSTDDAAPALSVAGSPDVQAFLPGLGSEEAHKPSPLENAVEATLREYASADLLKPRDAAKVALLLDLARVMAIKRRSGRTSTYSNDARLAYEILESFVAEDTSADSAVVEAMQTWTNTLAALGLGRPSSAA